MGDTNITYPDKVRNACGTLISVNHQASTNDNVKYVGNLVGLAAPLEVARAPRGDERSGGPWVLGEAVKFMAVVTEGSPLSGHAHVCGAFVGTQF